MSFTIFEKSALVDANEKNGNFYRIGQGSRLPMGGASLTATDSVYSLGDDTYRWNNVYCDNILANGDINDAWNLISEYTVNTTTSRIDFNNLNGDNDKIYLIYFYLNANTATNAINMVINGDSSASYARERIVSTGITTTAASTNSLTSIIVGYNSLITSTSRLSFSFNVLHAQSDETKMLIGRSANRASSSYIYDFYYNGYTWSNTSTITSLVFYTDNDSFYTGTNIQIWGIK